MGKLTISMAIFNSYVWHNQAGYPHFFLGQSPHILSPFPGLPRSAEPHVLARCFWVDWSAHASPSQWREGIAKAWLPSGKLMELWKITMVHGKINYFYWKITMFHGKINYFDWAMFHSYFDITRPGIHTVFTVKQPTQCIVCPPGPWNQPIHPWGAPNASEPRGKIG